MAKKKRNEEADLGLKGLKGVFQSDRKSVDGFSVAVLLCWIRSVLC